MGTSLETVAVLGAGSWGTALAIHLARNGHDTCLWGHLSDHMERLRQERCNKEFLPDAPFPIRLRCTDDLAVATENAATVLVVVPSHVFGEVLDSLKPFLGEHVQVGWATKGFEAGTGRLLHEVAAGKLPGSHGFTVVSGPTFATEVAVGMPTALTVAGDDEEATHRMAELLHGDTLRAYTSGDMVGVELGGAVKNVLAVAAGASDGLGFGANARAALITRGLAEMVRLGMALGGRQETFMGLAGLGDLVLTCTDNQSRNRRFGLAVGQGMKPAEAEAQIGQVVEGVHTVREVMRLARKWKVDMPISEQVESVVFGDRDPRSAVTALLSRERKQES
jgi:glycerol-3-phosphate dehydrogenase (NAD(P)+)